MDGEVLGAQLNRKIKNGATPVHLASCYGHLDVAKYLIDRGAEVESNDKDGMSPLHYASKEGNLDTVKYLVLAGARIEKHTEEGLTSLLFASAEGHPEVVQYLLSEHAEQTEEAADETDAGLKARQAAERLQDNTVRCIFLCVKCKELFMSGQLRIW